MSDDPNAVLVSTRERPGIHDGLVSAKPGEPLFTVQGGDPFGPPTVLHWVSLARAAGMAEPNGKKARRLLRKATDAEAVAWAMNSYQRGEMSQEQPVGRAPSYSGHTLTDEADAAQRRHQVLANGATKLHSALAEALLVAEALAKLREFPAAEVRIRDAVASLKESAFEIEPRRQLQR
jgi:hypothetical protein